MLMIICWMCGCGRKVNHVGLLERLAVETRMQLRMQVRAKLGLSALLSSDLH
jgi:hypothetical protein